MRAAERLIRALPSFLIVTYRDALGGDFGASRRGLRSIPALDVRSRNQGRAGKRRCEARAREMVKGAMQDGPRPAHPPRRQTPTRNERARSSADSNSDVASSLARAPPPSKISSDKSSLPIRQRYRSLMPFGAQDTS